MQSGAEVYLAVGGNPPLYGASGSRCRLARIKLKERVVTCHQIIESIMRQQSRSGRMPDAFYIHESELAGDDLVKSLGGLEFYNPHHPLHGAVIGRNFPNDKELVEAGLLIAGVPIKVSN